MFNRYYQQQLANLRELAVEFSKAHPALAPMLKGTTTDPDVERLLEGVAFMAGLLQEKIDDEFPEIIQGLMQLVFPHYLRPLPSATIMAFTPKQTLKQAYKLPAGVTVASKPVEGTSCVFRTAYDLEVHPLKMTGAVFEQPPGKPALIRLSLELLGMDLAQWQPEKLRFHLAMDYPVAANVYALLMHHLQQVTVAPKEGGAAAVFETGQVRPVGFAEDEAMIPYPPQSFPGYRVIQEFFILPQKFLFFDLIGWDRWKNRGAGSKFDVTFEFKAMPFAPPKIKADDFVLFATPAINLFASDADPVYVDHKQASYRIQQAGADRNHFQTYGVDKVTGFQQGAVKPIEHQPFDLFHDQASDRPIYHVSFKRSPIGAAIDAHLSLTYPPELGEPKPETLSIRITCTNGEVAENLKVGDINRPTASSPDLLEFRNIRPTTASVLPPLGSTLLWRFLSLYSLNYFSIAKEDNIKALLRLYIFTESRDQSASFANLKRVDGISGFEAKAADRLVEGFVMRGQEIRLRLNSDHFASDGDLYLFGAVLDNFFSSYASLNSFTSFAVDEALKGDVYRWPAKIGDRPLI